MKIIKRIWLKGLVLMMSILLIGAGNALAEPGPFENFFRKLRRSFSEPEHKSTHRTSHKQADETPNTSNTTNPTNPESTAHNANGVSVPPSDHNTRTATRAASKKGDDLRYGTPVPGKKGFVTSPFSPDAGYIDVRGFAPGTPVKDPYTGKVFLTP
jgi:hypothetical protein